MLSQASRAVLTLGVTAVMVLPLSAQGPDQSLSQLYHTAWTARDGAPSEVQALAQTTDGFLWVGTQFGLFRFDGVRFELFEPAAPDTLPSVSVRSLLAVPDGGLWIGYHFGGVSLLRGGTIRSYSEKDGLPRGSVLGLVQDSDGVIWLAATGGLARFADGQWHKFGPDEGVPDGMVTGVLADRARRLWVAGSDGVLVRAPGAPRFERVGAVRSPTLGFRESTALAEGPDGAVWASSLVGGLQKLAPSDEVRGGGAFDPRVRESGPILIDGSGAFWLAHTRNRGIERFGADRLASQRMTQGLSADVVTVWLEDREGNVWAGTTGGLDQFRRTKLTRVDLPGAAGNFAIAAADSGAVWVGSDGRSLTRVGSHLDEFPRCRASSMWPIGTAMERCGSGARAASGSSTREVCAGSSAGGTERRPPGCHARWVGQSVGLRRSEWRVSAYRGALAAFRRPTGPAAGARRRPDDGRLGANLVRLHGEPCRRAAR